MTLTYLFEMFVPEDKKNKFPRENLLWGM